ncbi:MAG: hypothetical protein HQ483_15460 [Rhodospirillales bacterium]|nr:hypothetical protein [Rhodospirillales bacterium]
MKYRKSQYHHQHFEPDSADYACKPAGFIKTTVRKLAEAFDVSFKLVVIGFVLLFMFTGFFALFVFLVAAHWVRYPDKYEDFFDTAFEKSRRGFSHMTGNRRYWNSSKAAGASAAGASETSASAADDDFDFSDLNRQFDELKRRTGTMEAHLASDAYTLNRQFDDLK